MTGESPPTRPSLAGLPRKVPCIRHGVHLVVAPRSRPPFPIDAVVVEDDTWQVVGSDPGFRFTREHPIRLMRELAAAEPREPGTVVFVRDFPTRLHAIVHDLDCSPTWREEWVVSALAEVFRIVAARRSKALGLPLLATRFGRLGRDEALQMTDEALRKLDLRPLRKLWLMTDEGTR